MWELFRGEVETQMRVFTDGLLALEGGGSAKEHLAATMRAAHSIKGAARIVHLDVAVRSPTAMEDCLVAAQEGALVLDPAAIDVLLASGDLLAQLSNWRNRTLPPGLRVSAATVDESPGPAARCDVREIRPCACHAPSRRRAAARHRRTARDRSVASSRKFEPASRRRAAKAAAAESVRRARSRAARRRPAPTAPSKSPRRRSIA
jgi:two-component system sensor histidine kinase and response regulator WspE